MSVVQKINLPCSGGSSSVRKSALKAGLKIIYCIGETLKERRDKKTNNVLRKQIKMGLKSIRKKSNIIIPFSGQDLVTFQKVKWVVYW